MKTIDMMMLYEKLTRENFLPYYRLNRNSRNYIKHKQKFNLLRRTLENLNISPEQYIKIQFKNKGKRIFPNQLNSKAAMQRYNSHVKTQNILGIHKTQEEYLEKFIEIGYTLEESLQFDIFYYYFRCFKLKKYPKKWKLLAKKELNNMPELKDIVKL